MQFKDLDGKIRWNGPQYSGAEMPEFDKYRINEESFYPQGRIKCWYLDYVNERLVIVTQEVASYMNIVNMKKEIRRFLDVIGYTEPLKILVYDRSGYGDRVSDTI